MPEPATMSGSPLPQFTWVIDVPERPSDLAKRFHNKYAKESLREAVERYHKRLFPDHYKRSARQRYNYAPRSDKYKRVKARLYRSTVDHVKTGRSKRTMTREYRIRSGGSGTRGNIRVTLILRFPFKGGSGRFRRPQTGGAVTIRQMILELQRFAESEPEKLAQWFKEGYMRRVEQHRKTRKRIRIS